MFPISAQLVRLLVHRQLGVIGDLVLDDFAHRLGGVVSGRRKTFSAMMPRSVLASTDSSGGITRMSPLVMSATSRSVMVSVSITATPFCSRAMYTRSRACCGGIGLSLMTVTFRAITSCIGITTLPVLSTRNGTISRSTW
jgi:hypothetical protein